MAGHYAMRTWVRAGVFIVHVAISVAAVMSKGYLAILRGQNGTAPATSLEVAANLVADSVTSPLVWIWVWFFPRGGPWLPIVALIANSALWAWVLEWMWSRTRARG
jgi:hypothetical protein